ncbi:MAG TPA: aminodeoxychorismate synthase component I [Solirubrobacterales bacterium]|nr:aminodeoxychorismate synthase component I [Solirubrobacterales bacterium]
MRTLLVDNHDSYTYNVFHLLAGVSGEAPIVVDNDAVSWRALSRWDFDAIVLSPGPGSPERWHDFCVCNDILRYSEIPVLGICLGHQGLGHLLDGKVASAPEAMHGRLSRIHHCDDGLFAGIPQDFPVVRYHSLAITDMGPDGNVTAWADDGVVMGIEHRRRPMWGVQFHPESIATEHGARLVENFYGLARKLRSPRWRGAKRPPSAADSRAPSRFGPHSDPNLYGAQTSGRSGSELRLRTLPGEPSTEALFERLFADAEHAFWLDSADAPTRLAQRSFLGTSAGATRCVLEYDVESGTATRHGAGGVTEVRASIFDLLDRELAGHAIEPPPADLPPGLMGGFVGYLGYELKADCGSPNVHRADTPDAVMMLANRLVAVDHVRRRTHLVALCHGDEAEAESWLDEAEAAVREIIADPPAAATPRALAEGAEAEHVSFRCGRGREQYLADIARSQAELAAGESYEVCLTDQISTDASPDPFDLYRLLRRRNPAPFAAYLKLGDVAVLSSSPERFLSVDRERRVEARPIKGTTSRSEDPVRDAMLRAELTDDEKTYAEHLMIVDLLRNDLGRVCDVGSVGVPELMVVEDYATVHQLISTVSGVLEAGRSAAECARACFPGGSMTGAPKERTMEIIDDLEDEARGVYSGAIGWFGVDGAMDLSIVIRTIVMRPGRTTIGAGGAIVMQSDPEDEFDEILLKARAPMATIAEAVTGSRSSEAWSVELEPQREAAAA